MNIISQPGDLVNVITGRIPRKIQTILLDEGEKWVLHKEKIPSISKKLAKIGKTSRAYRMDHCAETLQYEFCRKCGSKHIIRAQLCRDRFCPVCTWRLSMKRFSSMVDIAQGLRRRYPSASWQFVTLTVKNCAASELTSVVTEMMTAWDKIMRRRTTRRLIMGWGRSLEITYNSEMRTLHPHFHVLLLWREGEAPTDFLLRAWMQTVRLRTSPLAQDAQVIQPLLSSSSDSPDEVLSAVLETYKYSVKSSDLAEMPLALFRELDESLRGRRMIAFGGVVKEYAQELRLDASIEEPETELDEDEVQRCASCGSVQLIRVIGLWTGDGYLWRQDAR